MNGVAKTELRGVSDETIEKAGEILITLMRRRNLSNARIAEDIGVERSHLSRVRNGKARMSANMVSRLSPYLGVDRSRLVMAACVMGEPSYYFDPQFRNAAYFVEHVLAAAMDMPKTDIGAHAFSILSKEGCATFAAQVVAGLRTRFSQISPEPTITPGAAG